MKFGKRFAAMSSAMMLAITGMAMSASADTWSVYFNPISPYGMKSLDIKIFPAPVTISRFYDSCNTPTTSLNAYGQIATVEYWGYCSNANGYAVHYGTLNNRLYSNGQFVSEHQVPLDWNVEAGYYLTVKHRLLSNGNISSYSGSVHI